MMERIARTKRAAGCQASPPTNPTCVARCLEGVSPFIRTTNGLVFSSNVNTARSQAWFRHGSQMGTILEMAALFWIAAFCNKCHPGTAGTLKEVLDESLGFIIPDGKIRAPMVADMIAEDTGMLLDLLNFQATSRMHVAHIVHGPGEVSGWEPTCTAFAVDVTFKDGRTRTVPMGELTF